MQQSKEQEERITFPHENGNEFPELTMEERLLELQGCNKRGWVYKVGSLPNLPGFAQGTGKEFALDVFEKYIIPDAERTGVVTVFQRAGAKKGIWMNQEPYFHPEMGLIVDERDYIVLAENTYVEEVAQAVAAGIDFDPEALPSWQIIQENRERLRSLGAQVIKTQLTSLNCARFNLSSEVGGIQEDIMAALAVTHLSKAASLAPVVCVSLDNPNADVLEGLQRDMEVMLGMEWKDGQIKDYGLLSAYNIVAALHCCENYEMLKAMKLGVGLVHGDFATYKPEDLLRGNPQALVEYFQKNRIIAAGIIPQSENGIKALAGELGIPVPDKVTYPALVDSLRGKGEQVIEAIVAKYKKVVDFIGHTTGFSQGQVRAQCVPSYLCGFGGTKSVEVANYGLELAQTVSERIWEKT